jgi:hypothetical protein
LFVFVTALCGWLAWETSVVRERRAVLKELGADGALQVTTVQAWRERYPPGAKNVGAPATIPLVRRWLGDEAIQEIWHNRALSPSEFDRLTRAFPESEIRETLYPPCHPGCFPRGTLIDTPSGPRRIELIAPGDPVTTISSRGEPSVSQVQTVFVTENRLWKVETNDGVLFTTQTQPLCLSADHVTPAEELQSGDHIVRRHNEKCYCVKVLAASPTDRIEKVFNLILGDSETFIADGYLARSKPPAVLAGDR